MFYIIYPILYGFSLLPWFVIYLISDVFFVIIYHVLGYRKKVVFHNLNIAFPEKTAAEKEKIAQEFYSNLIDTFLEMIKLISISKEELNKRLQCNYSVINQLHKTGQNVQLHGGHFFNWEFINLGLCVNIKYPLIGVYERLTNKAMNKIILKMRGKFGTILIHTYDFKTRFHDFTRNGYALGLAADQNPGKLKNAVWLPFFNKMTPFVNGPEKGAKLKNTAIVFGNFYKLKRGYYQCDLKLYTTEPTSLPEGQITKDYRDFIENCIKERPANYLWSHRRWKWEFDAATHGDKVIEQLKP